MEIRKLFTDERAVSPVVGVALLIAIAVILAAVIGAVVLGLGTGGVETPQAQLQADYDDGEGEIEISHNGGEPLPADHITFVADGDEATIENDLSAGNSVVLTDADNFTNTPLADGATVVVLWEDPNSDSETVLEEFDP